MTVILWTVYLAPCLRHAEEMESIISHVCQISRVLSRKYRQTGADDVVLEDTATLVTTDHEPYLSLSFRSYSRLNDG